MNIKNHLPKWTPVEDKMEELKAKKFFPTVFFELIFNGKLFDLIVEETNRYASQNYKSLNVMKEEIKCFIGILLLSGYLVRVKVKTFLGDC